MKRPILLGLAMAALLLAPVSPAKAENGCGASSRGRLLSTTELKVLSRDEVVATLRELGLADRARYGARYVRLVYCTITPDGDPTAASGLLALPLNRFGPRDTVLYAHGTVSERVDAPSFQGTGEGQVIPLVFTAEGFTVAAPDYLGLGVSRLAHPYVHAATEASASIDMLPAARLASARLRAPLTGEVFVTGFSQGGHAAMAVAQRLTAEGQKPWRLRAVAPMAGPYDLSGLALPALLDPQRTDPASATAYAAYLLAMWKVLYGIYDDPRSVFTAPYADTVEGLFDGEHDFDLIAEALPDTPGELLLPETLAWLSNPDGRLLHALRENDVCRWAPTVPVRIFVGQADRDVAPEHARRCHDQIAAAGGRSEVADLGPVDHVGTAITGLPMVRDWFLTY
ncbi:MAG TPA: hypothetical protein VF062_26695 [Candidatus Limnocylindrales bacterium]